MTEYFKPEFLFLTQEDVIAAGALDMKAAQADIELAYKLFSSGQINQPHKPVFQFDNPETGAKRQYLAVSMPVYVGGPLTGSATNGRRNRWIMPNAGICRWALILSCCMISNMPSAAIMEGGLITAMRTSAVAGVGAKVLARPNSKVAGLVGAGVIGRTMIMSLTTAMPKLEEIRLFDLNKERAKELAKEFEQQVEVIVVDSVEQAFKDADIVTTQTTARQPFVEDAWIPKGSYYAHMAAYEGKDEVFINTDRLVVDNWATLKTWDFFAPTKLQKEGKLKEEAITDIGKILLGEAPGGKLKQNEFCLPTWQGLSGYHHGRTDLSERQSQRLG